MSLRKKKEKKRKIWILAIQSVHVLYQYITLLVNKLLHLHTSLIVAENTGQVVIRVAIRNKKKKNI